MAQRGPVRNPKAKMKNYWHAYGSRLARRGWPVIPVIPPDADIDESRLKHLRRQRTAARDPAEQRRLDKEITQMEARIRALQDSRGKAPGDCGDSGSWWGLPGEEWIGRTDPPHPSVIRRYATVSRPPAGIGLSLGGRLQDGTAIVAVDADCRDPQLANALNTWFLVNVTCLAPVRIGAAPKWMRLVRVPVGDGQVAKPVVQRTPGYRLPGDADGDKPHAVELLAHGRQVVVYGRHPSGVDYHWPEGELADLAPSDLPVVEL